MSALGELHKLLSHLTTSHSLRHFLYISSTLQNFTESSERYIMGGTPQTSLIVIQVLFSYTVLHVYA